jgi:hypothetical protein
VIVFYDSHKDAEYAVQITTKPNIVAVPARPFVTVGPLMATASKELGQDNNCGLRINHHRNPKQVNVFATQTINPGSELFLSYGILAHPHLHSPSTVRRSHCPNTLWLMRVALRLGLR